MDRVEGAFPTPVAFALAAPGLCVLHCLAAPVLVVVAPALAENPLVELALAVASVGFALSVAYEGVLRHGERRVWIPVLLGTMVFLTRWLGGTPEESERLVTVIGSMCLLTAIVWDSRLRRNCTCEGCGCTAAMPDESLPVGEP